MKKRTGPNVCYGCRNTRNNAPGRHFFRFPKEPIRCELWVHNGNFHELAFHDSEYLNEKIRLCSDHFENTEFKNQTNLNSLNWNAVPTKFYFLDVRNSTTVDRNADQQNNTPININQDKNISLPVVSTPEKYLIRGFTEPSFMLGSATIQSTPPEKLTPRITLVARRSMAKTQPSLPMEKTSQCMLTPVRQRPSQVLANTPLENHTPKSTVATRGSMAKNQHSLPNENTPQCMLTPVRLRPSQVLANTPLENHTPKSTEFINNEKHPVFNVTEKCVLAELTSVDMLQHQSKITPRPKVRGIRNRLSCVASISKSPIYVWSKVKRSEIDTTPRPQQLSPNITSITPVMLRRDVSSVLVEKSPVCLLSYNVPSTLQQLTKSGVQHKRAVCEQHSPKDETETSILSLSIDKNRNFAANADRIPKNLPWVLGTGFLNMGNTCYVNTILQSLFHLQDFTNFITYYIEGHTGCTIKKCLFCSLKWLLKKSRANKNAFAPACIVGKLKDIDPDMTRFREEDSMDFFRGILSKVDKTTSDEMTGLFGGVTLKKVSCSGCGYISVTKSPVLELPIQAKNLNSIQEGIENFLHTSALCTTCNNMNTQAIDTYFHTCPTIMCIHLLRFVDILILTYITKVLAACGYGWWSFSSSHNY